jgi:hypothetical protein
MNERRAESVAIVCAVTAAAFRLIPLHWLHAVNWDEIEFYRATRWIAEGRLPFRDFWEHHSPLPWFVFAPVAALIDSIDTSAIVALRWTQLPVWIAAFYLANRFMREAGLSRFGRWAAMAVALSSSFLMASAIEFRVDPLAIALYLGGLVAWQRDTRRSMILSGVLFCLTGMANLRLGPLLVVTVLLLRIVDRRERTWRGNPRANWIFAGGAVTLAAVLLFFAATDSWQPMVQQLLRDNVVGEGSAPRRESMFLNRVMVAFGVHVIIIDRELDPSVIDPGGIVIILGGIAAMGLAFARWRRPDDLFVMTVLQAVNILTIIRMKYVYNYHFQTAVLLMLPMLALLFERFRRRQLVVAMLAIAWCVNVYASVLRGKEDDRAYQDVVMREAHARTRPDEKIFAGIPWGLHREPAYYFWFLPELARQLVAHGHGPPYSLRQVVADPPALVIADRNVMIWFRDVQRELTRFFLRHYTPVWRSVWIPGPNGVVRPGGSVVWLVPRSGEYRLYVSASAARHPWFLRPVHITTTDLDRVELRLPEPRNHPALQWSIEGRPVAMPPRITLRKGQRIAVTSSAPQRLAVFLLNSDDRVIFRQPPPNVTLEAASPRVTHWPSFR